MYLRTTRFSQLSSPADYRNFGVISTPETTCQKICNFHLHQHLIMPSLHISGVFGLYLLAVFTHFPAEHLFMTEITGPYHQLGLESEWGQEQGALWRQCMWHNNMATTWQQHGMTYGERRRHRSTKHNQMQCFPGWTGMTGGLGCESQTLSEHLGLTLAMS